VILHDVTQGEQDWLRLRAGYITATTPLVTAAKFQPSASVKAPKGAEFRRLLAERLLGAPIESGGSGWTDRGTDMEPEARAHFALSTGLDVRQVGFVTADDDSCGCSPDGLVYEDDKPVAGVELKVPAFVTHLGFVLDPTALRSDYWLQCQFGLYVTGLDLWYLASYNPHDSLPNLLVEEIEPDLELHIIFDTEVAALNARLDEATATIKKQREAEFDGLDENAKAAAIVFG